MIRYLLILLPVFAFATENDCRGNCSQTDGEPVTVDVNSPVTVGETTVDAPVTVGDTTVDTTVNSSVETGDTAVNMDIAGDEFVAGDTSISTRNQSAFFSFSTSFPNASGCMGGIQGGAQDTLGLGGFLGVHKINPNCWLTQLAEAESHYELRARLKCGDKHFRNAVSFDVPGKQKHQYCVDYTKNIYLSEIEAEKAAAEKCKSGTCAYVNGQLHYFTE